MTNPQTPAAASHLEWVNELGRVNFLLSDGYGHDASVAEGAGIVLSREGQPQPFLGRPKFLGGELGKGPRADWSPIMPGASIIAEPDSGHRLLRLDFNARPVALPLQTLTPGKVRAQANVVVRVQ